MPYKLAIAPERRLSLKIIVGRLRRLLPEWVYALVLRLRYACFRRCCDNPALPDLRYSDGAWTTRKTTADLSLIQDFLLHQSTALRLLQIGIGNSSLFRVLRDRRAEVVGITVVADEIAFARATFPEDVGGRYQLHLVNKYARDLVRLGAGFDYIVDNDLSSYACCRHHFHEMLDAYRQMLKPGGAVLVGLKGLGYFDSGFGLTPAMMRRIAVRHGFDFARGDACYLLTRPRDSV